MVIIPARARTTDPHTSHEAAASVEDLIESQWAVLHVLKRYGPQTHEELVENYHIVYRAGRVMTFPKQSDQGIRSRCAALVKLGLAENSGEKRPMKTGRNAIVWRAK